MKGFHKDERGFYINNYEGPCYCVENLPRIRRFWSREDVQRNPRYRHPEPKTIKRPEGMWYNLEVIKSVYWS
jgi:hypothetical protein